MPRQIKPFLLLIILSSILTIYRSYDQSILISDELIIEDISYGMAKGNSLTIPTWLDQPLLTKPPLLYWLIAPFYIFLPAMTIIPRLPMIGFGIGLVITTYLLSKILYDKKIAFWSGLLLLTSSPFIFFTKTSYFDLPNAFFITLSVYLYVVGRKKKQTKYFLFSGISIALSLLTRSWLSLFLPFIFLFDIFFLTKRIPGKKALFYLFLLPFIIVAPWHLSAFILAKDSFISQYILYPFQYHLVGLIPGDYSTSPFYYLAIFALYPQSLLAVWYFLKKRKSGFKKENRLLLLWIALYIVPLLLAKAKYFWYLVPILPPLAIIAAVFTVKLLPTVSPLKKTITKGFLFICLISGPIMLAALPFPEAENVNVAKMYLQKSSSQPLYILDYPLVPLTRFFLNNSAYVVSSKELKKTKIPKSVFIMGRPESFQSLPHPKKLIYQSSTLILAIY